MSNRWIARALLVACLGACMLASDALGSYSEGTPEQIAWVRRAAANFVNDELAGNGAGACSILNAPLRATVHHQTCEQRMDARLTRMLHTRGERARLRGELAATRRAIVVVRGDHATIALPQPLMAGANHFLWTENCWMLEG